VSEELQKMTKRQFEKLKKGDHVIGAKGKKRKIVDIITNKSKTKYIFLERVDTWDIKAPVVYAYNAIAHFTIPKNRH